MATNEIHSEFRPRGKVALFDRSDEGTWCRAEQAGMNVLCKFTFSFGELNDAIGHSAVSGSGRSGSSKWNVPQSIVGSAHAFNDELTIFYDSYIVSGKYGDTVIVTKLAYRDE